MWSRERNEFSGINPAKFIQTDSCAGKKNDFADARAGNESNWMESLKWKPG